MRDRFKMIDTMQLIETCKQEIAYAATYAGLDWRKEDIVSVNEKELGEVVFLRRFNPHEVEVIEYNEYNEPIGTGKTIIEWCYTMWFEEIKDKPALEYSDRGNIIDHRYSFTFQYNIPRLVCPVPWLVRIIAPDGSIKGGRHDD
jgi:hypothetical protein